MKLGKLIAAVFTVLSLTACSVNNQVLQNQSDVESRAKNSLSTVPRPDVGLVRESGLYLGSAKKRSIQPAVLGRKLGGPGLQALEPKSPAEAAYHLAAYIDVPIDVAADVYQRRSKSTSDNTTSVSTDSAGISAAIASVAGSNSVSGTASAPEHPVAIRYRFLPSQTVENVLSSITQQFGLSWKYDSNKERFTIFRYSTEVFDLPIPNTERTVSMEFSASVVDAQLESIDALQKSMLEGAKALSSEEGRLTLTENGVLVVSDRPANVDAIRKYVDGEKKRLLRQVVLQVRLLSFDSQESEDLGLNWNAVYRGEYSNLVLRGTNTSPTDAIKATFELINPTSRWDGSMVEIDALAESSGISVEYENNLLSLTGRATGTSQGRIVTYLKEVTAADSTGDVVQSTLTPGEVETGLALYMHPLIVGDDIVLSMGMALSSLIALPSSSSGESQITTPETSNRETTQVVKLRNGGAVAMTGFYVEKAENKETGAGEPSFKVFGGNSHAKLERRRAVLVVSANIVE